MQGAWFKQGWVGMATNVLVKVVGFTDVERHSLNTLLRLSAQRSPSYVLWTPDVPTLPQVALIDVDSYEAGMELASPRLNPHLKLICVGSTPHDNAWRNLARPVDWAALVQILDSLFTVASAPSVDLDVDFNLDGAADKVVPPGVRVSLMVGMALEPSLYLRCRLALAGLTDVDEAPTAARASEFLSQRHYDVVIVNEELGDADPWALVQSLSGLLVKPRSVIVVSRAPTWTTMERAEKLGCLGLLEMPFNPQQVVSLLQKA